MTESNRKQQYTENEGRKEIRKGFWLGLFSHFSRDIQTKNRKKKRMILAPSDRASFWASLGASFGDPVPTELHSAKGRGWGKIYELPNIGASFWVGAPSFFMPSASFWGKWSVSYCCWKKGRSHTKKVPLQEFSQF